jgi:hypothetical protein
MLAVERDDQGLFIASLLGVNGSEEQFSSLLQLPPPGLIYRSPCEDLPRT